LTPPDLGNAFAGANAKTSPTFAYQSKDRGRPRSAGASHERYRQLVLGRLGEACLLDRVLAAGAYAGCWGTMMHWGAASLGAGGRVFLRRGAAAG
jgi:hypothetical protein